jgi:glyoxylase-like metal-dependent hydrolase (beta-lactamase superfamily II)
VTIVDDPVYLEEPFIRSTNFILNPGQEIGRTQFDVVDEIAGRPKDYVPHYLPGSPGALAKLTEYANEHHIPPDATRGGAVTTYPEYQVALRELAASTRSAGPARTTITSTRVAAAIPDVEDAVQTTHVQGKVYMLSGAGANITAQIGDEGVLLVDTGATGLSDKVMAALRQLTDKAIRIVINTHVHPDHVGGNEPIAKIGQWFGGNAPGNFGLPTTSARVIAHEQVLTRMSAPVGQTASTPFGAWPTETFFTADKELFFNGEAIQLLHQPAAHTDGDVIVFFRRSDVVSAGDLFTTTSYPVIDAKNGGTIQGFIAGVNHILDVTIPEDKEEGGTYVIPGHGRVADEADVVEFRDMVTIVRDRVQDLMRKGMTLAQVKAARPTLDYDRRYGLPDAFLESLYRDLTAGR